MEKENQLDRIDASVNNFGNTMMQTTECFNSLNELTGNLVSAANNYIDLQRDMHKMDVQFNAYVATLDAELERHKGNLPVVERQLNQINQMMDKVLDKVLSMDANTDIEMDMKMKYMETLQTFTDKIATMMIKLL
ncbi:unknown [Prevotella sp. CAG:255]|uniref:hypothetical protein n=1 Tax=Prevotella sp. CAG:255 TaxID=1262923 RepID=UPI00033D7FD2|nr:hypothetical protein [Prevotella sp. CAG:255]CCX69094.1 unknown [Prevotella sp. CAG:255]